MTDKLTLPRVTLFAMDSLLPQRTASALQKCVERVTFGAAACALASVPPNMPDGVVWHPTGGELPRREYKRWSIEKFVDFCATDFLLTVQHDGYVLNPAAWTDAFLEYDYIGAPWPWDHWPCRVGNSGFCLRSKRLLQRTAEIGYQGDFEDDAYICRELYPRLIREGFTFAPVALAAQFSQEQPGDGFEWNPAASFGFHGGWAAYALGRQGLL